MTKTPKPRASDKASRARLQGKKDAAGPAVPAPLWPAVVRIGRAHGGKILLGVFFVLFYLDVLLVVQPQVLYHGDQVVLPSGETILFPVYFQGTDFLSDFLRRPGGLAEYVAACHVQYFYYPYLGAAVLTVVAGLACLLADAWIKCLGGTASRSLRLVPPLALLAAYHGYTFRLEEMLAILVAVALAMVYLLAANRSVHAVARLALFAILSPAVLVHHAAGDNPDVFDYNSDLGVYDVETGRVSTAPAIANPDRLETFPAWSPDGRYLYFSSAAREWSADLKDKGVLPNNYNQARYDLVRVRYDLATGAWGEVETVLSARETGLSINEPRISPDGRFLLFSMAEYGSFPVYRKSSDLYMMDLATRRHWKLDINSPRSDSWHSWSSNSRWIAFASKRRDGLFGRIYLSYVDTAGNAHKPILLPQRDPAFYDSCIQNFNVPELIAAPVAVPQQDFLDALESSGRQEPGSGVGTTEGA